MKKLTFHSTISTAHFHNEEAAYAYVEACIWPDGPVCPHCAGIDRIGKMKGVSTRIGLYKCYKCRKPFNVKIGTVFQASHVPLRLWLQAIFLIASSKKGISSNQFHRTLGVTLKTAWFMSHRIREAMRSGDLSPFGTSGGPVEVDETFIGRDPKRKKGAGYEHKHKVLSLIDRDRKRVRSMVVEKLTIKDVTPILQANIAKEAHVMTDQAGYYYYLGDHFRAHDTVNHTQDEYARKEDGLTITTNTIEGYFSIFKRGMKGVYQHCGKNHLHRYLAEFDFRYNQRVGLGFNDTARADVLIMGVSGKRLKYRDTGKLRGQDAENTDQA